jgi:hypothetical protein
MTWAPQFSDGVGAVTVFASHDSDLRTQCFNLFGLLRVLGTLLLKPTGVVFRREFEFLGFAEIQALQLQFLRPKLHRS